MSEPSSAPEDSAPTSAVGDTIARLERRVRASLALNGVLVVSQVFVMYLLFAVILAEPAQIAGVTDPNEAQAAEEEGDYREELRDFFDRTSDLLDREARKQGVNPADVLPSDEQINDAVETRTIHSDESQKVLQKLREGFEYFDLTWPLVIPER